MRVCIPYVVRVVLLLEKLNISVEEVSLGHVNSLDTQFVHKLKNSCRYGNFSHLLAGGCNIFSLITDYLIPVLNVNIDWVSLPLSCC